MINQSLDQFQDFRSKMQPSSAVELTQSADAVAGNDDLLRIIHLRLPSKSQTRFKSVNKHWLTLISDLQSSLHFKPTSHLFLQSLNPDPELAVVPFHSSAVDPPEFHNPGQPGSKIEHSSNGLICYSRSTHYPDHKTQIEYFIFNPTTNKSAKIPLHGSFRSRRMRRSFLGGGPVVLYKLCGADSGEIDQQQIIHVLGVYVAFDPLRLTHYRVLCVSEFSGDLFNYQIRVCVYKPELGSWSEQLGPFKVPYAMCYSNGVYWNRGMFWAGKTEVTCFFLAGEFLKVAAMPRDAGEAVEVDYFGVSRDRLMAVVRGKRWDGVLKVYEMGMDYSGWVLRYECDVQPLIDGNVVRNVYSSFPLAYVARGNEGDETCLVLGVPDGVVSYDLKSKMWKTIRDFPSVKPQIWSWRVPFRVFPFDQTLCDV